MQAETALRVTNLSKTFPGGRALSQLNLRLGAGEVRALLGENGSGKSTFIKILAGYHRPDDGGEVAIGSEQMEFGNPVAAYAAGARFVHQDLGLVGEDSILDNFGLVHALPTRCGTVRRKAAEQIVRGALERVGLKLDPRRLVNELSPAEKTGVAVARAVYSPADGTERLLVLDEPTATLPASEVRGLLDTVRAVAKSGVAVLYVTHRLEEVFAIADQATVLRDGREVITTKVEGLTRDQLLHHLLGSELDEISRESAEMKSADDEQLVLNVNELHAGRLQGVSLELRAGEIVGVAGVTGSGRDDVTRAIFGAIPRSKGIVRLAGHDLPAYRPDLAVSRGVGYLPPDRKILGGMMELTARENISITDFAGIWRRPWMRKRAELEQTKEWFERLGVSPPTAYDQRLLSFSGGNQQKILLAKWLRLQPKLLLLDEPTQGVDVGAKAVIHKNLLSAAGDGMAVLVNSVDNDELVALCHRILIIRNGRLVRELAGDQLNAPAVARSAHGAMAAGASAEAAVAVRGGEAQDV